MILGITSLKKGIIFKIEEQPYKVISYNQKVMGRGGSIVSVRVKSLIDGKVLDKTFKGNDQVEMADVVNQSVNYLYSNNNKYYFMNNTNFDQFEIEEDLIKDYIKLLKPGDEVQIQLLDSIPINIEMPKNVNLKVTYTESAVRGDTSSAITKEATLETGLQVKVPVFIKINDIVSIDTTSFQYRERIKE